MKKIKNITNQRFGSLIAVRYSHTDQRGTAHWTYLCACGNEHTARASTISYEAKKGDPEIPSCGCVRLRRKTRHGFRSHTDTHPAYRAYRSMMDRCYSPHSTGYERYGGRGVTVCEEWRNNPEAFVRWSLDNGWAPGLQIDKDILCKDLGIDPPIYSPETCQWVKRRVNIAAATSRDNFGKHPNVKLSHKQADDIVIRHFIHGEKKADLARRYGVAFTTVWKIIAKAYEPD